MANRSIYEIVAKALGFGKADKKVKKLSKSMKNFAGGLATAGAAYKALGEVVEGAKLSAQLEGVESAYTNMSKELGFSVGAFKKFDNALDGTVNKLELMKVANTAMTLGITDNEDQMADMLDIAQRLAKGLGEDTLFGVESLVPGLGRQSVLMLDNLGVMVDQKTAQEKYAKSIKKTVNQLSDADKKQAFMNEALEQGRRKVDAMGEEYMTTSDKIAKFETSYKNLQLSLGAAVIDTGIISWMENLADSITGLIEIRARQQAAARKEAEQYGRSTGAIREMETEIQNLKGEQFDLRNETEQTIKTYSQYGVVTEQVVSVVDKNKKMTAEEQIQLAMNSVTIDELINKKRELIDLYNMEFAVKNALINSEIFLNEEITPVSAENITNEIFWKERKAELDEMEGEKLNETIKRMEYVNSLSEEQYKHLVVQEKAQQRLTKTTGLAGQLNVISNTRIAGSLADLTSLNEDLAEITAGLTIAQASADTWAGANRALATGVPPKSYIEAAAIVATGVANVARVVNSYKESSQYGFEGVVDEPTEFTVGEAGAEMVTVTPLEGVDNAGAGVGGGVNVVIQGNVMTDDFVENELAEKIAEAVRRGTDFGIS